MARRVRRFQPETVEGLQQQEPLGQVLAMGPFQISWLFWVGDASYREKEGTCSPVVVSAEKGEIQSDTARTKPLILKS